MYKPVILNYKAKEMFDDIFSDVKMTYDLVGRDFIGGEISVVYGYNGEIVYRLALKDIIEFYFESEDLSELNKKVMKHFLSSKD